jgi:hypothetical protein
MERMNFRTKPSTVLALLLMIGSTVGVAWGANPHYNKGNQPICSPLSNTVTGTTFTGTCTAGLASGVGNVDLTFGVIASVTAGTFCHNPGNSNIVPGQNPATAQFANLQTVPASQIKNGTASLSAVTFTFTVSTPTPAAAGCPNDSWTVTLGTATWTASYVVYQPFPTLINSLSFSF